MEYRESIVELLKESLNSVYCDTCESNETENDYDLAEDETWTWYHRPNAINIEKGEK